jgi:Fe-S cluster assembly protein SufD
LSFTADASRALGGPDWLARRREAAFERFGSLSLPTEAEDLWKYSDVDRFDLDAFTPDVDYADGPDEAALVQRAMKTPEQCAAVVLTINGRLAHVGATGGKDALVRLEENGLVLGRARDESEYESVHVSRDAFDELHSAFVGDVIDIDVRAKSTVELPVYVYHVLSGGNDDSDRAVAPAHFPHLRVHVGASASAKVVEVFSVAKRSQSGGLVVPVTELDVSENAHLSYATMQLLPESHWRHFGVQSARVGRDATLRVFCGSLGGEIGRLRADAALVGEGAEATLVAGYHGIDNQLHDLRTIQDHIAPRTRSELLCMGAVGDTARSAYVGMTRVRNGAHGADAFQTNNNLVLSEGAHADSVPNLDIQENDVRCSHASTVGPIDEEQLYYLESRGIEPSIAKHLIVLGFFRNLADRSPIQSVGDWFVHAVAEEFNA